jgi:type I restriction enzyme, S subunit
MSELPEGWATPLITDVASSEKFSIVDGPFGSDLKLTDYTPDGTVPVLTTKNLNGRYDPTTVRFISAEKFEQLKRSKIVGGDILIAKIGSIGKCSIYPKGAPAAIIPANLCKISVDDRIIDNGYLFRQIESDEFQTKLREITSATAQPAFSVQRLRTLHVKLSPLNEQRRIVAKLEKLLSSVDAAQVRLATISLILKRFRQSVLAAASSGRLTTDWRENNPNCDASSLVARLEKAHEAAGGHKRGNAAAPTDEVHDLSLDQFPSTWRMTDLRAAVCPDRPITYGILKPGPDTPGGIPYVRVADFPNDSLNLSTIRRTTIEIEKVFARSPLA